MHKTTNTHQIKILAFLMTLVVTIVSCTKGKDEIYPVVDLSTYTQVDALTWYGFHHQELKADYYLDYGSPNAPIAHPTQQQIDSFAVDVTARKYKYIKLYVTTSDYKKVNS